MFAFAKIGGILLAVVLIGVGLWKGHTMLCQAEVVAGIEAQVERERDANEKLRGEVEALTRANETAAVRFSELRRTDPGCEPWRALRLPRCELERRQP